MKEPHIYSTEKEESKAAGYSSFNYHYSLITIVGICALSRGG